MSTKNSYYAVFRGHKPGIYGAWENDARLQVDGFPNSSYKGYRTYESAKEAIIKQFGTDEFYDCGDKNQR